MLSRLERFHCIFLSYHLVSLGGGASASVFASTMGSVVIRYSITLSHPDKRLIEINRAFSVGKNITSSYYIIVLHHYIIVLHHITSSYYIITSLCCSGKDYALLHAAPIVAVFILDHSGVPIPCPYEIENRVVPVPDMHTPHYALICTQEQLKVRYMESHTHTHTHTLSLSLSL